MAESIRFYVGDDPRRFESEGAACSLALTRALREQRTQYVRSTLTERPILIVDFDHGTVVVERSTREA